MSKPSTRRAGRPAWRECLLLVEAGDLDDELHAVGPRRNPSARSKCHPCPAPPARPRVASPPPAEAPVARTVGGCPRSALAVLAARARRAGARHPRRLPRLPDVSRTTTATTRCCGAASCSRWTLPRFEAYRAPTEHPLAIVVRRAAVAARRRRRPRDGRLHARCRSSALVAGVYRARRRPRSRRSSASSRRRCCARASTSRSSRARGYIDIPYLAFVVWAAALEARAPRRRRRSSCWSLLAAAGLLRPEAWLLAGLYFLWMCLRAATVAAARPLRAR